MYYSSVHYGGKQERKARRQGRKDKRQDRRENLARKFVQSKVGSRIVTTTIGQAGVDALDLISKPKTTSELSIQTRLLNEGGMGAAKAGMTPQDMVQALLKGSTITNTLKDFILDPEMQNESALRERYRGKSSSMMSADQLSAKGEKNRLDQSIIELRDKYDKLPEDTKSSFYPLITVKIPEIEQENGYYRNFIRLMTPLIEERRYQEKSQKADQEAVSRGFANAEQAQALREVEIEHYFKTYGIDDPIEILARQRTEKSIYGMTSFDAAMAGQQLIPPEEELAVQMQSDALTDTMTDEVALANQEMEAKKKQTLLIGGVAIVGIGLFIYMNRSK